MEGTMIIFRAEPMGTEIKHFDRPPALEDIRDAIGGGYIELVPYFDTIETSDGKVVRCVAFCDEHGKINKLPLNRVAIGAWFLSARRRLPNRIKTIVDLNDVLVGDVCVLFGDRAFMEGL